jgi:hypothetical protein
MIEQLKLLIGLIVAMLDAMPQEFTDNAGAKTKIPDANYITLLTDGVMALVTGSGFQIVGFTEVQLRGALAAFIVVVRAWKNAPRLAV